MKKTAILCTLITLAAVSGTLWQCHVYNQDVRRTLEAENVNLRQAMTRTEVLIFGHEQTIVALETKLKSLTNQPVGAPKSGNS